MLVDDEDMVRKRVINNIDWEARGFNIVCEAENGQEAYERFLIHQPDVVITDIKMPFMDGLELSEKILNEFPLTKIIVLTGFDEFDYAKRSVELHLTNYLLKPVSMKELMTILDEVKQTIDDEIEERRNANRLRAHYDESFPLMRQRFMLGLIEGSYKNDQLDQWLEHYKVTLTGNYYMVSVVHIDDFVEAKLRNQLDEIEMKKVSVLDMVKEVNETYPLGNFFIHNDQVVIITARDAHDKNEFINRYRINLERLRQAVNRYQEYTVTIGMGRVVSSIKQLQNSYTSALNAIDYKLMLGENQIINIQDTEPVEANNLEFSDIELKDLRRILKLGTLEELRVFVERLFDVNQLLNQDKGTYQIYILELVTAMIKTIKEMQIDSKNFRFEELDLFEVVLRNQSIEFVTNSIVMLGEKIMKIIQTTQTDTTNKLVTEAKTYVNDHYSDETLNVESVAGHLHYTPNYLSSMFKKETGNSFMSYILEVRLSAAKKLLETTDMKNFEVAIEVGFSSANYFSFCFKKELGISPTQYKRDFR